MRAVLIAGLIVAASASTAAAQNPPVTSTAQPSAPTWEIEGTGGIIWSQKPGTGLASLPPAGLPIATTSPIFPSRQTPSWFFGDGAALLNSVLDDFGQSARLQPLDAALGALGVTGGSKGVAGFRIRRVLHPGYAVEFSLDVLSGTSGLSDEFLAAVEATLDSFQPAFTALFASGPIADVTIQATSADTGGSNRQIALTAALVQTMETGGSWVPYATVGAGVTRGTGDLASVSLEGRYRFTAVSGPPTVTAPFDETDRVTIRFDHKATVVGVVGGGVRRDVSRAWGLRLDGRVFLGRHNTTVFIDADPSVATLTPADFIETFTNPGIQFSNNASAGRRSSLGAPALEAFEAFKARGFQARVLITIGIFARF